MRHGVDTTIVEIDPAVYNAAKTYFGLPDPGEDKVFLQDARGWVARRKDCVKEGKCPLFDAAIHDCFSGGGVPQHIFTLEFWNDLRSIMHPDGVLVLVRCLSVNDFLLVDSQFVTELCRDCQLGEHQAGVEHFDGGIRSMSCLPRLLRRVHGPDLQRGIFEHGALRLPPFLKGSLTHLPGFVLHQPRGASHLPQSQAL